MVCVAIDLMSPFIAFALSGLIQIGIVWVMGSVIPTGLISGNFNIPIFYAFVLSINVAFIVYTIGRKKKGE